MPEEMRITIIRLWNLNVQNGQQSRDLFIKSLRLILDGEDFNEAAVNDLIDERTCLARVLPFPLPISQ